MDTVLTDPYKRERECILKAQVPGVSMRPISVFTYNTLLCKAIVRAFLTQPYTLYTSCSPGLLHFTKPFGGQTSPNVYQSNQFWGGSVTPKPCRICRGFDTDERDCCSILYYACPRRRTVLLKNTNINKVHENIATIRHHFAH